MQKITLKTVSKYLYDQLTGNFLGFLIGASATGLVSHFFETRGIRNLWGLTSKKTVVDKATFENLEWIISIVIGFIVFEIMTKVVKAKLDVYFPKFKRILYRWLIQNNYHHKLGEARVTISQKRAVFYSSVHQGVKKAFNRSSN